VLDLQKPECRELIVQETFRILLVPDLARSLLLAATAFIITVAMGGWWIRRLRAWRILKRERGDVPAGRQRQSGTPTMGGILILVPVLLLTVAFNLIDRWSILLPLMVMTLFAVLGALDDRLSLVDTPPTTHGLSEVHKFLLTGAVAFIAALALYLPPPFGLNNRGLVFIPFFGSFDIGWWFIPLATFIILGSSHAVNFTDGLDGLAGWNLMLAFASYGIIAALDGRFTNLMAFSFTLVGACAAFLWFNAQPAQVFMGDLGALSLGAVLGVIALQSQQWLLLGVVGFVFVVEALSVMAQRYYYKWTRIRTGTPVRILRRAPLHHHFQLLGWSDSQVLTRFVLVGLVASLIGISLALTIDQARDGAFAALLARLLARG
jgi:phospho-N-acetylmuramoyl-pentapeptide-transferase